MPNEEDESDFRDSLEHFQAFQQQLVAIPSKEEENADVETPAG